jgi:hypothetical protein
MAYMSQTQNEIADGFPQTYVVSPSVKAMSVPVQKDPALGHNVIFYLKFGTAVNVLSKSELWLRIQLPNDRQGFIQISQARPATSDELLQLQKVDTTTSSNHTFSRQPSSILTTATGLTSKPIRRASTKWIGVGLLPLAFFLCILGDYFAQGGVQACYVSLFLSGCTNPYASLGNTLMIVGFLVGVIGALLFFIALIRAVQRH